jgi:hypothetical protein
MTEPITSDLHQLNLRPRTYSALHRAGVHTIADLLRMGQASVSGLYLIGPFALHDITQGLEAGGFCWTVEEMPPLPELPPAAAQMVDALGLGDSAAIRTGLARVLRVALEEMERVGGGVEAWYVVSHLEHGAR